MKCLCSARLLFLSVLIMLMTAMASHAAVLVEDGQNRATIVMAPGLPGPTRHAVDDLANAIAKITGAQAPAIVDSHEKVTTPVTIWVGMSDALKKKHASLDLDFQKFEELLVAVRGNDVILVGRDIANPGGLALEAGSAQAVYAFMQKQLDVRWLWPGELGTDMPSSPTLEVEDMTWRFAPLLRQRLPRVMNHGLSIDLPDYPQTEKDRQAIADRLDSESGNWLRRMHGTYAPGGDNYQKRISAGHAYTSWYKRFHETHPEYFALQPDGSRDPFPSKKHLKLDIANPAVAQQVIDDAAKRLGDDPGMGQVIKVSPNDGGYAGYCVCEDCKAWDAKDGPMVKLMWKDIKDHPHVALTDRYVHFWNRVARGLKQRYPSHDVAVGTWAYTAYRTPPVNTKLDDNVLVGHVTNLPILKEDVRQRDRQLWKQWADAAPALFWRPNFFHELWGMPALFTKKAGEDFKFLADNKMVGLDIDSYMNHWSTQGLQYYVLTRLAWDPHADVDAIVDDYTRRAFGPEAAPHMRAYFQKQEDTYDQYVQTRTGRRYESTPLMPETFNEDYFKSLQDHLSKAKAAVTGPRADVYRQRLAFVETGLNFAIAQMNAITAMNTLRQGGGNDVQATVQAAYDATQKRDQMIFDQLETHALNSVYLLGARARRNMLDFLGPPDDSFKAILSQDSNTQKSLPFEWDFRMDPTAQGHDDRWFDDVVASKLEWRRLQVTKPWNDQILSDDPVDPAPMEYHGLGWYRTHFTLEPAAPNEKVWLEFGAIDESAHVYLNSQLVGHQKFDATVDRDSWQKPRRFDITTFIQSGRNHLAVAVESVAGLSGITRPAIIRRGHENLLPNPNFNDDKQGWRITSANDNPDSFATSTVLGSYVDEKALRLEVREDGRAAMRAVVNQPLQKNTFYKVAVRYRQKLTGNPEEKIAPLRLRFYGLASDGSREARDRFWLHGSDEASTNWQTLGNVCEAKRDYERFSVTIFLWTPGVYDIDEVIVQPIASPTDAGE